MEHHMAIEKDLLDQLLAGRDPKDVFNKDGRSRSN
jgi:putative transposase